MALLLHQHGPLLPPAFLAVLQQQLTASIFLSLAALGSQAVADGRTTQGVAGPGVLGRRSASPAVAAAAAAATAGAEGLQLQQQLLWTSRCLCELASCWPAALHTLAAAIDGDSTECGVSTAAGAADEGWGSAGTLYDASEGACGQHHWPHAEVAAAQAKCSSSWQQLWDGCVSTLAAADAPSVSPALQDSIAWLLHVLIAQRHVQLPSKAAALLRVQGLFLPQQPQQAAGAASSYDNEAPPLQQQVVLSEAQLALLLSLCLGQQVSSQREMLLRQQLLLACLNTAEAWSSDSRRSSRYSTGARSGGMGPPAPVVPATVSSSAGKSLPDLLLPAMLALLGAPGLPIPSLNGAPAAATMASAAAARLAAAQSSWGFDSTAAPAAAAAARGFEGAFSSHSSSTGADTVWYTAAEVWWGGDHQLEAQLAGLEAGLDTLRRQLAAERQQQLVAAADVADARCSSTTAGPTLAAAEPEAAAASAAAATGGDAAGGAAGEAAGGMPAGCVAVADAGWWKCWCRLADEAAEHLCNVSALMGGQLSVLFAGQSR